MPLKRLYRAPNAKSGARPLDTPRIASRDETTAVSLRPDDVLLDGEWSAIIKALRLSPREAELIRHAFHGRSLAETAKEIGISEHTVHTYRGRMYRKLGVTSLSEAVAIVFASFVALSFSDRVRPQRLATPAKPITAVPRNGEGETGL